MIKKIAKYCPLLILAASIIFIASNRPVSAAPQVFVVNTTGDNDDSIPGDGICATPTNTCTLRAAIQEANSNNNPSEQDIINFNISPLDGGTKTIIQSSEVTTDSSMTIYESVKIDGYTQDDAVANSADFPAAFDGTLRVEISGDVNHTYAPSIRIAGGAENVQIQGLVFSGFAGLVIDVLDGVDGAIIQGNYINTTISGTGANHKTYPLVYECAVALSGTNAILGGSLAAERNVIAGPNCGVVLGENSSDTIIKGNNFMVGSDGITQMPTAGDAITLRGAQNVTIGGPTAEEGNLIENAGNRGIGIENSASNITIQSNRIVGNYTGVSIDSSSNIELGGDTDEKRNVISGNTAEGVQISNSDGVNVLRNYIGVTEDGVTPLGNGTVGLAIQNNSTDVTIGSPSNDDRNVIANNSDQGITVNGDGSRASILANSIYDNGEIGIDIYTNGVSANDVGDGDNGPNNVLNFPSVYIPVVNGANMDVGYNVDIPAGDYLILFYSNTSADSSGNGEGETYIGSQTITSLGAGRQEFSTTLTGNSHTNVFATATFIDSNSPSGYGYTSEFGDRGTPPPPETDIAIEKTLLNPEDAAPDATLNYQIVYTNEGPDPLDLSEFDDVLAGQSLFTDYMSPDLEPVDQVADGPIPGTKWIDVGNSDLLCLWAGPGSAGGFLGQTGKYADYAIMICWYYGSDPELADGGTFTADVNIKVASDSELASVNIVTATIPQLSVDPDEYAVNSNPGLEGKLLLSPQPNNLSIAVLPQNMDISVDLVDPDQISLSNPEVYYDITITNSGVNGIDLSYYFGLQSLQLNNGLFAAAQLDFVGSEDANISCSDGGPGSYAYLGAAAQDHPTYNIFVCVHDPQVVNVIAPGDSYTYRLKFNLKQLANFNFYTFNYNTPSDPDLPDLYAALFGASEDMMDTVLNNNFAKVAYLIGDSNSGGGSSGGGSAGGGSTSALSDTGDSTILLIITSVVLIITSSAFAYKKLRKT